MSKMSESSIAEQYSRYLQSVMIFEIAYRRNSSKHDEQQGFLTYDEFKDYYILALVGKDNYAQNLANKIQHKNLLENA